MPRRKKNEEGKADSEKNTSKEEIRKKKSSSSKKAEKYIDPDKVLDEYLNEIVNALGISYLNLSVDDLKEVLREPFASAVGEVKTKPKVSTIINRLKAMGDRLMEIISYKLLRLYDVEKLSEDQLEFIVTYGKGGLIPIMDKLYKECLKRNRKDLIDLLRVTWSMFASILRSPIKCPKCEFDSVMPDLSCRVCGYMLSMKELKNTIHVIDILQDFLKMDRDGFYEILKSGFFYYTSEGPIPPSRFKPTQGQIYFEVILNKEEKSKLESISHSILPGS
ncbi:hypothetical protein SULI_09470 [Saccharolobus solfataricus]|uniref:Uncharacterized protein n=3 Tax=Saccharolobus solfataricus TaxID=2287 RepID=Q97ZM6_SACS2|nr:hypothetical protein [Saccharolobus solfataricus]AAK41154.1 Conserved hypothetical protein [Saccharolobus solfataricus P2]AKA74111.1 hypothetical protein SULB_1885 [Saccharolobus solfataricus]AKA76809.1 hypothetical protein SULC_1883 [Saccharolobus solfataricus]AKA79502.1 hypothetical protein SULA_1884 [Saccharolobus solfataricus]AZF68589.1 hypothetical protein SULG_09470 [Saccharolobus solfataricus]